MKMFHGIVCKTTEKTETFVDYSHSGSAFSGVSKAKHKILDTKTFNIGDKNFFFADSKKLLLTSTQPAGLIGTLNNLETTQELNAPIALGDEITVLAKETSPNFYRVYAYKNHTNNTFNDGGDQNLVWWNRFVAVMGGICLLALFSIERVNGEVIIYITFGALMFFLLLKIDKKMKQPIEFLKQFNPENIPKN
ncbi:MAG: hypothetical protein J6M05_06885 [Cardiobacteriaceae bacterium]|nr:hypothetical protein [Cardiobacteriaceae bacterium]